jgi:hypothetical protein
MLSYCATEKEKDLNHKIYICQSTGLALILQRYFIAINAKEVVNGFVAIQFCIYLCTHQECTYTALYCFDCPIHVTMMIMMIVVAFR